MGRLGDELDHHADFWIHDPYFSFCPDRKVRASEQELDQRLRRERGLGSQEASPKTETHQRAADGRIMFVFTLRTQPFLQTAVRSIFESRKLNACMTAGILPRSEEHT